MWRNFFCEDWKHTRDPYRRPVPFAYSREVVFLYWWEVFLVVEGVAEEVVVVAEEVVIVLEEKKLAASASSWSCVGGFCLMIAWTPSFASS